MFSLLAHHFVKGLWMAVLHSSQASLVSSQASVVASLASLVTAQAWGTEEVKQELAQHEAAIEAHLHRSERSERSEQVGELSMSVLVLVPFQMQTCKLCHPPLHVAEGTVELLEDASHHLPISV